MAPDPTPEDELMLISTLPDLGGRAFDPLGFVFEQAMLGGIGGSHNTRNMVQSLIAHATRFGADAVIDVKTVLGGDGAWCVMTGTAVKIR
jgi:hypothetical protein